MIELDVMEQNHDELLLLAINEENIAIDATRFEARDRAQWSLELKRINVRL